MKVAVVTGSNRGIGFACVRALCKHFKQDGVVYLTSRKEEDGKKAVADLQKEGLNPRYHQLDISDKQSVETLRDNLKKEHGGMDILVNNAAIAYKRNDPTSCDIQAKVTNQTNYFDTAEVYKILSPILRPYARVVNVSSYGGRRSYVKLGDQRFSQTLYCHSKYSASGEKEKYGYTTFTNYGFSKLALSTLTRIQNKEILKDVSRPGIRVYSACPGRVKTEMSSWKGEKTPDEGADTLVWLALQPEDTSVEGGEFFKDRKVIDLYDEYCLDNV